MLENTSVIFVDDDPNVLRGLRRRMIGQRPNWSLRFYDSAEQALVGLEEQPTDVVISDMRMALMDGAEFQNASDCLCRTAFCASCWR